MKILARLLFALALLPSFAWGQGTFRVTGAVTSGDCVEAQSITTGRSAGEPCMTSANLPFILATDYGVIPNDGIDDAAAFNAAFDAAKAATAALWLPAGTIQLNSKITQTLAGAASLNIIGSGEGTRLYWPNSNGGLDVTYSADGWWVPNPNGNGLWLENLTFVTNQDRNGTALYIDCDGAEGRLLPKTGGRNLVFRGNTTTTSWSTAVHVDECYGTSWQVISITGQSVETDGIGFDFTSAAGAAATEHKIDDLNVNYAQYGIRAGDYVEGIQVVNSDFVNVDFGVWWETVVGESYLAITNSHFNLGVGSGACVHLENVQQNTLNNNLCYADTGNIGFDLDGSGWSTITGNVFTGVGGIGIQARNTVSGNPSWYDNKPTTIEANSFDGFTTGVALAANTAKHWVGPGNVFTNTTTALTDAGLDNAYLFNLDWTNFIWALGKDVLFGGLKIADSDNDTYLEIYPSSDMTANRRLSFETGDQDRTVGSYAFGYLDDANEAAFKATVNLEANTDFYVPGGTDVAVADGGTGQSTAAGGFDALKQAATDSYTGVVELATTAEVQAGTDTTRAVTSATVRASYRERLTANRTYYVRTDGSDSNTCLIDSAGGACLTVQKAIDIVYGTLDLGGFNATVQVGDGTFTGAVVVLSPQVGAGTVTINGNVATPANVILTSSGTHTIGAANGARLVLANFEVRNSVAHAVRVFTRGNIIIGAGMRFGTTAGSHLQSDNGSIDVVNGAYSIVGNASAHWDAQSGGLVDVHGATVTIDSALAFSGLFAWANMNSTLSAYSVTFTGAGVAGTTGTRYLAQRNGVIFVNGGGANYFPGDVAGSVVTGGIYE